MKPVAGSLPYAAAASISADARQAQDGFFYVSTIDATGVQRFRMVCEDCGQVIPRYVDFPTGLTSPESDGDKGGNFIKRRWIAIPAKDAEGAMGWEHLQKAVCLPCYLKAYARVYPGAPIPDLRDALQN